jgi:hypothetical protein
VSLSATAINGFASQVSIQVSGLPTGISISPTSITLTPGIPQQVTFSAAANVATTSQTITFTGVSDSLTHVAQLSLSVSGGTASGPFTAGRTKYVRTDATTEYFQWLNSRWIIYSPVTNYFYVTDPSSNHLIVLDAASETEVGVISVPGAYTVDDTPDHSTLWIASIIGDLYTVDPVSMVVTNRYIGSQIGPSGYLTDSAVVLADGRLALLGGTGGSSVDGTANYAIWNPADNSFSLGTGYCNDYGGIAGLSRTVDRTKILLSNSYGGSLCEVDEATGQGTSFGPGGFPDVNFRLSPDGKYIVVPANTNNLPYANVYDAATLNLVSQIPVSGNTSTGSGFAISADSTTLFTPDDWTIYAYDLASGQPVGWLPNVNVPVTSSGGALGPSENPNLQAVDGTGLLVGPMEEGVAFIDATTMRTGAVGSQFPNGYLVPGTGPTSGSTQVQITEPAPFDTLSAVYFGPTGAGTNISGVSGPDTYGNFGSISATSPSGTAGPSDVYVFTADGGMQLMPEGFSYGPTIIEVTPNMSTGEGGGTGVIYGYGFGPVPTGTVTGPLPNTRNAASSGIPSSLHVSIGGNPVEVTSFVPYAYPLQSPPFPLQSLSYTIPAGTGAADVTVTSATGSATAHAGLTYLPSLQQFPLSGSALAQGIYDRYTDLYYFTDTNEIQVFSKTQGSWQSPIAIPAPKGATQQRLWGIALSPDGSKMAVSDLENGNIYVLSDFDNANPTIQTFSVRSLSDFLVNPCGLAISDSGNVYFMLMVEPGQGSGADQFFKLDTANGTFFNYGVDAPGLPSDAYLRNAISSDNSRVFFNELGIIFYVETATDTIVRATISLPCCYLDLGNYDLALSSNQEHFEATGYFYDFNLNGESLNAQNDREILNIAYVYGAKLSPDGRLFFQPSTNGIDIFDGYLGNLLNRVSLPVALSPNYDALVEDGTDNILIAITGTGNGIAVVDLTSINEPPPLPYTHRSGLRQRSSPRQFDARGSVDAQRSQTPRTVPHVTTSILPHTK